MTPSHRGAPRTRIRTRARRGLGAVALIAAASLALSGCALPLVGTVPAPAPTALPIEDTLPAALAPFYGQELAWEACEDGMTCATVEAPRDWDNPEAGSLSLDIVRAAATGREPKIGSLLLNPGGPGASGYEFVADQLDFAVDRTLRARFDVIGVDPRGVGRSTPVTCLSDAQMDEYLYGIEDDSDRGSPAWIERMTADSAAFGAACAENTGPALEFITTVSAARDMDLLRALLGDEKLNYLGYSYGTFLGATYANLYPEKAGRLVLDGAIDPSASNAEVSKIQAAGFESALRAYLTDCLSGTDCPFTGDVEQGMTTIADLLDTVGVAPITGTDGRRVGSQTLLTAIIFPLYAPDNWSYLSAMLGQTMRGQADTALLFADQYNGREDGVYINNSTEAFGAYNCADYTYNTDPAAMAEEAAQIEAAAPVLGKYMTYGDLGCAGWPYPGGAERAPIHAAGSPDILVLGTTNDPATPYSWAVSLAEQLENGHLITYNGEGHTAYNKGSACVNDAVNAFLIDGTVPESDPGCR